MKFIKRCGYCGKKLLSVLLSVLILSAAVFYVSRLAPGDPLISYYGERAERLTPEERERAEEMLGLHGPLHTQYLRWLQNAARGEFGISYKYKTDVLEVIRGRAANTVLLGGGAFVLIFALAFALGILCARHEGQLLDRLLCRVGTAVSCIPEFWLSLVLLLVFSVWLRWLPSSGAYAIGRENDIFDRIRHLILPMTIAVLGHLWYYAFMIRNQLLTELRAEYVLLAQAKGLGDTHVLLRHCLRNILPSSLSLMAISVPHILGGTYIIETVFSYPGIGTLAYESARYQDYNLLMVLSLFTGIVVILSGSLARLISERIDPRLREAPIPDDGGGTHGE